jgi:cold shock CspA family protein
MGKSIETYSKKEREKKKLKKQEDKKQKTQERKTTAVKGKSLEDMMAFVDHNGNITTIPPDPAKRKKIIIEDVQISVPKQELLPQADIVRKGIVSFFNESKGFGFIEDSQTKESVFVHINQVKDTLIENDLVSFETEQGPKGLMAIKVKKQ